MEKTHHSVGKRKTAVARVYLKDGSGNIFVNDRGFEEYFTRPSARMIINQPFELTNTLGKFDVYVNVCGGGYFAQANATKHGISKALLEIDPSFRLVLKKAGFLTRDSREVERKKYGKSGARKRYQFSKR